MGRGGGWGQGERRSKVEEEHGGGDERGGGQGEKDWREWVGKKQRLGNKGVRRGRENGERRK